MWFVVGVALSFGASLIGSFIADYFRPTSSQVEEKEENESSSDVLFVPPKSEIADTLRKKRDLLEQSLGKCNLPWDDSGCSNAIRLGEELDDLIKKTTKNIKKTQQIRRILNESDRRLERQNDLCSLDNPMCGMDSKYMYSSWW